MASQTLTTSKVTFVDYTDNRKLEIYISANLPQTQIYNPNSGAYSPDWNSTNLVLQADVFLDYEKITNATITWYEQLGTGNKTAISTDSGVTISTNRMLNNTTSVTYICEATYQNTSARSQIIFIRSDSGINGSDGTSVTIKDTAYYNGTLGAEHTGEIVSLYTDAQCSTPLSTSGLASGDAYIVQGYLCVYNKTKDGFICTGEIRGPQGESAKNIILSADAQIFRVDDKTITPATITVTGQAINTSITEWSYSIDGGKSFSSLSTPPSYVTIGQNQVSISGSEMTADTLLIKASDGTYSDVYTVYKVFPGKSAAAAFLTNENVTFSADTQGKVSTISMTTNIVAYNGTEKVLPTIGTMIDVLPEGMTITVDEEAMQIIPDNKEIILLISIADGSNLGSPSSNSGTINIPIISPVSTNLTLSWSKINTGATGANGMDAVAFQVYSAQGYVLSKDTPSILLQTFAYNGDTPIGGNATYQWYKKSKTAKYELAKENAYDEYSYYYIKNSSELYQKVEIDSSEVYASYFGSGINAITPLYVEIEWEELMEERTEELVDETTGESTMVTVTVLATSPYTTIRHKGVLFSASYMCKMRFNNGEYVDVVTIDDKNDTNTVFTSKPTSYAAGDIWIVGNDYIPKDVEIGTVLKAQHTNSTYTDNDWVVGTKYDDKLNNLSNTVGKYQQYISLDTTAGITMNAIDANGKASEFSTTLSNTQLSFNQGSEAVAYINNHKMHITEAEIESPLTVTGKYSGSTMLQAPTINLGSFSIVVESNGSLSMVSNL